MYSPRVFHDLMLSRLQAISEACHRLGLYHLFGTDGNVWPVAEDLYGDSGIDGHYEVDRKAGMDILRIHSSYPHITMIGNISSFTLHTGSPEDVEAETQRLPRRSEGDGQGHRRLLQHHHLRDARPERRRDARDDREVQVEPPRGARGDPRHPNRTRRPGPSASDERNLTTGLVLVASLAGQVDATIVAVSESRSAYCSRITARGAPDKYTFLPLPEAAKALCSAVLMFCHTSSRPGWGVPL